MRGNRNPTGIELTRKAAGRGVFNPELCRQKNRKENHIKEHVNEDLNEHDKSARIECSASGGQND